MIPRTELCPRCDAPCFGFYFQDGFDCPACGAHRKTSVWGAPIATFGDVWHSQDTLGRIGIVATVALMLSPLVLFAFAVAQELAS